MNAVGLARRALRAFAPLVAMLAIVTASLALVATAIPRSVDGFLSEGLRYDAAGVTAVSRDVLAQSPTDVDFGAGAAAGMSPGASAIWGLFDTQLDELRLAQPHPLRDTLGRAEYTVVTAPESISPTLPQSVSLGYDPRFLNRVTIVQGEEPGAGPRRVPSDQPIEVIASVPVADSLGWIVGDTRTVALADRLEQPLVLVGLFEAKNPDDPYWEHTTSTLEPTVDGRNLPPQITATVFADAAGFPALLEYPAPFASRSSVWYPVSGDALHASTATELAQQVRKFSSATQPVSGPGHIPLLFRSNLPDLLEGAAARSASSQAILATILAGPIGLAIAIEILVARLAAARLRDSLALLRARGASAGQRRLLLAVPALVIGVVAAAIGCALAWFIPGGELGAAGIVAVVATSVVPAVLLVLFGAGFERTTPTSSGRLRVVGEAVIVLTALASVASVAQRGNGATASGSVDLIAAAVPLALTLLGCVVTLRIYPVILRRALGAAHRSRGVSAFFGLARALRAGSAGLVPVLAVVIGVSVAVFSGVLSATLAAGTETASEARVGADIAIDNVRLDPAGLDAIRDVDGVAVAAGISSDVFHRLTPQNVNQFPVTLVLVDPEQFAAAQQNVPGALALPDLDARSDGTVPLGVSTGVATIAAGESVGELDFTDISLIAEPLASEIFNTSQNWVIADVANAEALDYPSPVVINQVLVKLSPGASISSVRSELVDLVGADATLTTASDIAAILNENPAVAGIRAASQLAILASALLSATALALTTVLDGRARRTALALLATLGLGRRQARQTVVWELAPLSIIGLAVGVLLGAALSAVVLATVDLRPFTAGLDQPAATVDPVLMLSIVGAFVLLLVTTVIAAARHATRRPRPNTAPDTGWDS